MLTIVNHRDDGAILTTTGAKMAYTQVLLSAIFTHSYSVCDPVHPTVLTMASGTHHCLDMPYNGDPPDGGVDLFDYIHFLKVRMPGSDVVATDILHSDVLLDDPTCAGGRRSLLGEHPEADWVVSDAACEGSGRYCHYTCNSDAACRFSMRPIFESSTNAGSFSLITAPSYGFKTMSFLFSRSAKQAQCTSDSPNEYCYDLSGLTLVGDACSSTTVEKVPSTAELSQRLGIFTTDLDCSIAGTLRLFSPNGVPIEVDFLHRTSSSPLPATSIETSVSTVALEARQETGRTQVAPT